MSSVTVRNAEIVLHFRVIEIERTDVARVLPEGELALFARVARFLCVDEPALGCAPFNESRVVLKLMEV
ncbi:MAG TPA: hypothetical protein VE135_06465 [Pyrinomonadaceae bacterium]|nr:hypothetical protein [Pyrinomonadaceae bacterium]